MIATIISTWGMLPEQLPNVVETLAAGSGLGPHATLLWLFSTVRMMECTPGRKMCRILAPAADHLDEADANRVKH